MCIFGLYLCYHIGWHIWYKLKNQISFNSSIMITSCIKRSRILYLKLNSNLFLILIDLPIFTCNLYHNTKVIFIILLHNQMILYYLPTILHFIFHLILQLFSNNLPIMFLLSSNHPPIILHFSSISPQIILQL